MALNKEKLKSAVETALENQKKAYDEGDNQALTPEAITDAVVDQVHDEVEVKLEELIKLNIKLINTMNQAFGAVAPPPALGAPAVSIVSSQLSPELTKLNKMLVDIKSYQE